MRGPGLGVALLFCLTTTGVGAATPCAPGAPVYIPLEPVRERYGIQGETREQFLDRIYPSAGWQLLDGGVTVSADDDGGLQVYLPLGGEPRAQRIRLFVEVRLDYLDAAERSSVIFGHREFAQYRVEPQASATIQVPYAMFPEAGSLLVVSEFSDRPAQVRIQPVGARHCERRVYVADRFTVIRRQGGRSK